MSYDDAPLYALFPLGQASMDGRLAEAERLRGSAGAAMPSDRQKILKIVPVEHELFTLALAARNLAATTP